MRIGFELLEQDTPELSLGGEQIEVDFDEPFLVELSPEQWLKAESGSLHGAFSSEQRSIDGFFLHLVFSPDEAKKLFLAKSTTEKHVSFSLKQSVEVQLTLSKNNLTSRQKDAIVHAASPDDLFDVLNEEGYPALLDLRNYRLAEVLQQTITSDAEETL